MDTTRDRLRKIDFFAALDAKILKQIAELCVPREYSGGEYIIRQGETGLGLFFVLSGGVRVEIEKNGAKTAVAQLKQEEFFGELSIIDNRPRSASVVCSENTSCLLLTRDSFSKLMNRHSEIPVQLARVLAERLRATTEKLTQQSVSTQSATPGAGDAAEASGPTQQTGGGEASAAVSQEAEDASSAAAASSKERVREFLVSTFRRFYTLKAMTRFSAAVVGCPVSVRDGCSVETAVAQIGDVKIAVFPSNRDKVLHLDALDDGAVTATVLRPGQAPSSVYVWGARRAIQRNQTLALHVPKVHSRPVTHTNESPDPQLVERNPEKVRPVFDPSAQ